METVDFNIVSADTVPINYTWDAGVPFDSLDNTVPAYSTTSYTSGYAPGLKVRFSNLSKISPIVRNTAYNWNFGDYYNDTDNFTTTTSANTVVEHTYVMPGRYAVILNAAETLPEQNNLVANDRYCLGRHVVRWFWDDLTCQSLNNIRWDETKCNRGSTPLNRYRPKTWGDEYACLGKYCKAWSWMGHVRSIAQLGAVRWNETQTGSEYEKKWQFEPNNIECAVAEAIEPFSQTTIKQNIIEVFEVPPVASMHSVTQPVTGTAPFTVTLTPKACKTGSFPIDRIDWNLGDGTPTITVTRYTEPANKRFTKAIPLPFPDDPADVRNYNVTHTYNFTKDTYPIFYPSLTCYSANTNTADACSITIGPLSVSYKPNKISLVKGKNTSKGNIYALEVDDNITFVTSTTSNNASNPIIFNTPTNPIKNSINLPSSLYTGNSGNGYLNAPNISLL